MTDGKDGIRKDLSIAIQEILDSKILSEDQKIGIFRKALQILEDQQEEK